MELDDIQPIEVSHEADGTIVVRFAKGVRLGAENTGRVLDAVIEAAAGDKCPVLADIRGVRSADLSARQLGTREDLVAIVTRMGILVGNPATRIMGNFFVRVQKPSYLVEVFDDEQAARTWLRGGGS